MKASLHDAFEQLATEVRPVDLAPRVARGVRRRRQRQAGLVAVTALAVVVAAVAGLARYRAVEPTVPAGKAYEVAWVDDQVAHPQVAIFAAAAGDATGTEQHRLDNVDSIDVSPDGRQIAYVADRRVEVAVLDGKRRTLDLTLRPGDARPELAWAPDSRRLAVSDVGEFGDARGFYVVDTVSGDVRHVAHPHHGVGMAWSPDGRTVALSRAFDAGNGPPRGVDLVPLDGGPVRTLGAKESWYLGSTHAWSPDGTRLVVLGPGGEGPSYALAVVVDVAAGTALGTMEAGRYVWRSADRLAVLRRGGVVETTTDGRVVRTLYPFPRSGEPIRVAIRAAS